MNFPESEIREMADLAKLRPEMQREILTYAQGVAAGARIQKASTPDEKPV